MIDDVILLEGAKAVISPLINEFIIPKIASFAKKCKIEYNNIMIPRGEHFEEYLYRTYKKYSIINTIALKNEQKLLKDIYIPLTIVKNENISGKNEQVKIDEFPQDIMRKYNNILITDTAGMGKSTMTKRLFIDIIDNGHGIPIYIELRRLNKNHSIIDEIIEQFNSLSCNFDTNLLFEFIQTGGFIIFLDGYDEIALDDKNVVTCDMQNFIEKASDNLYVLTSRPEQAITSFGNFQQFSINPLNKKEAYELLRKYDKQGNTSRLLIDTLKSGQYSMVDDFLKNPLLVSLLFIGFDHKQTIPLKKHIFYRQVYDAYFDSHDLSKGDGFTHDKKSRLDIDDFDRVLRHLGFQCLGVQQIEFDKDTILKMIDKTKKYCADLNFSNSNFLEDILVSVPLFCKDGQYYRWAHKSLQEYFAAEFIYKDAKNNQDIILSALYNSKNFDNYINLLDLYLDIDKKGFSKNITLPALSEYVCYYDECIGQNDDIIPDLLEKQRIGLIFGLNISILHYVESNEDKKQGLEYFINARKLFSEKLNIDVDISEIVLYTKSCIFVHTQDSNARKTIDFLESKGYNIMCKINDSSDEMLPTLLPNHVVTINHKTGCDNKELYENYNHLLYMIRRNNQRYINYDRCKNIIAEANSILNNGDGYDEIIAAL